MLFKFSQILAKAAKKPVTPSLAQVLQSSGILPAQALRLAGANLPSMSALGWIHGAYPVPAPHSACSALSCRSPMHHSSGHLPQPKFQHSLFQSSPAQLVSVTRSTACMLHCSWHGHARHRQVSTSAAASAAAPSGNGQPADDSQQDTAGFLHPIRKFVVDQFLPLGLLASMALGWVYLKLYIPGLQFIPFAKAK